MLCYDCNSATDSGCGDPVVDLTTLVDYQANCTGSCKKVKTTIFGGSVEVRSCDSDCEDMYLNISFASVETSCCYSDLCNGAHTKNISLSCLTVLALIVIIFSNIANDSPKS